MKGMLARGLLLAGLAAKGECLQLERKDVGENKKRQSMLVVLNGYPGGVDLLQEQGKRVRAQGASLMLTSHEETEVSMDDSAFKVHAITPNEFCSTPAVGTHKRNCNRADADNKFLGAALLANSTSHGFRWLLLGDDDTTFHLDTIEEALEGYDPKDPHFLGMLVGRRGDSDKRPAGYEKALQSCPRLQPDKGLRFWSVNLTSDVTDVKKDCDPKPFRDDSWFQWAKGGNGIILSAGLLNTISASDWQQCVDRIVTFGGDVRIAMCLALLGHRVEKLEEGASGALSEHKLDLGVPSQHKSKTGAHAQAKRGDMVQHLKNDKLFSLASVHTKAAKSVSEDCGSWKGEGLSCEIEYPEHNLVRAWIPPDATVMEFGARFGTTSCEIAKQQNNSGNLIVVEPDLNVWDFLEENLNSHSCNARMLRGAVSSTDLHVAAKLNKKRGYSNRPVEKGGKVVPGFRFHEVQEALGKKVDTLLIDCEGCAQFMMDQISDPIKSGQIKLIIIEGDMPVGAKDCKKNCMDYEKFFGFLTENGFEMVDKFNDCDRKRTGAAEGQWCGTWIDHFAWRLKGAAPDLQLSSKGAALVSIEEKTEDESKGETEHKAAETLDSLGAALAERKAALAKAGRTKQEVNHDSEVVQMVSRLKLLKTKPAEADAGAAQGKEKSKTTAKKAATKEKKTEKKVASKKAAKKTAKK
jgi:FkbM family methyltransferase